MKLFRRIVLLSLLIIVVTGFVNYPKLNIISGYAAKNMASTHFIAGREYNDITENDNNMPLIKLAETEENENGVTASVFGLMERSTFCREGLGCVLVSEKDQSNTTLPTPRRIQMKNRRPFPFGNNGTKDSVFGNVDYELLQKAIENAFSENEIQKTRTVLVVYKGHIVAEKYIEGFTEATPILGWSMTKSVLATLFGILEYQGKLKVSDGAPVDAWQEDGRKEITLDNLLRMQSGLAWEEDYTSISDVTEMLFLNADMTTKQAQKEAIAPPGEVWNYSSGTSNLLSGILRKQFTKHQEYLDFPYEALIDKMGMHSMLIEADMEGNFVGSSYGWANTRDWAKFGLLYLNKGQWNGEQLFDPKWVDYVRKPTDGSGGAYGAHFWLNAGGKYPDVPKDLFSANGYQGQYVFIIPSKDLVIVRTGLAEAPDFDVNRFLREVVSAVQ
ncbi:serine hydrolase [Flavobacteriaceae bacterium TP-CH-4]|uniref:Serine hydrolase n=1 Tax=Pelagihabitans pacificus TaxID=2696054 RepID=A0A967B0G6_9FLAO|nr:serine hydrolase [Pelagihabitans pacificus]NHF59861.1 serine hydrolase [Pelagihabitans pacificus]